jgi:hypothetical protein
MITVAPPSPLSTNNTTQNNKQYDFEECFDHKEVRQLLKNYCNGLNCEELILFVEQLSEFSKLRGESNKAQKAYHIYNEFIVANQELTVNIKHETREKIQQKIQEHMAQFQQKPIQQTSEDEQCAKQEYQMLVEMNVFVEAEEEVMEQVKNSVFPLFIKTSEFESYIKKKQPDNLTHGLNTKTNSDENSADCHTDEHSSKSTHSHHHQRSVSHVQFQQVVLDNKPKVSEKHITALIAFSYSTDIWKTIAEEKTYKVYTSDEDKSGNRSCMVIGTVPFNFYTFLKTVASKEFRTSDKNISSLKEIEYIKAITATATDGSKELSSIVTKQILSLPWPMSNREIIVAQSIVYLKPTDEHNERYIYIYKTAEHTLAPKTKSLIRGACAGGYVIEKLSDNETKYHFIAYVDLKGWISKKIITRMHKSHGHGLHVRLMTHLGKMAKVSTPNTLKALDTLNDYMMNHHQTKTIPT